MSITQKPFGIDQIGRPMTLYTMTNKIAGYRKTMWFNNRFNCFTNFRKWDTWGTNRYRSI